jgi:hypothetical protein
MLEIPVILDVQVTCFMKIIMHDGGSTLKRRTTLARRHCAISHKTVENLKSRWILVVFILKIVAHSKRKLYFITHFLAE